MGASCVAGQVIGRHQQRLQGGRTGSCLELWKSRDVRGALWAARRPGRALVVAPAVREVVRRRASLAERQVGVLRIVDGACCAWPRSRWVEKPLQDAWIRYVMDGVRSDRLCFFSMTYSDEYGDPHGLMLARNVQADFQRALKRYGFASRRWCCAVEPHPSGRRILHAHALIADMSASDMKYLEAAWTAERGWSKAVPCHDGGVRYTCKYALKGADSSAFDWRW